MTRLSRAVRRETSAAVWDRGRNRQVIVSIEPGSEPLLGFRLKGTRRTYYLRPTDCFRRAVMLAVQERKRMMRKAR